MKSIGFVISRKPGERRRAMLPEDMKKLPQPQQFYFEAGYGEVLGIADEAYRAAGVNLCPREEALACDIICDVKAGDADYIERLPPGKTIFGWAHAAQKAAFTAGAIAGRHTVIAWEEMDEMGRNIFYRNREIAGEAGVMQAFLYFDKMPYDCRVAVLGRGNTAKGALRVLNGLGATVDVFGRKTEKLFKKQIGRYDVVVNCVMWDITREDYLIARRDLRRMKRGAMLVDISCDGDLAIETGRATTPENPVFTVDGIIHYAVDNTPALFPKTSSAVLSKRLPELAGCLVQQTPHKLLKAGTIVLNGEIVQPSLRLHRQHRGEAVGPGA